MAYIFFYLFVDIFLLYFWYLFVTCIFKCLFVTCIFRYLFVTYGFRGAFLVLGGMVLNVCVAACIFMQPRLLQEKKMMEEREKQRRKLAKPDAEGLLNGDTVNQKINTEQDSETKRCACGPDFRCSLFKNPRFVLYILSFVFCLNGYGNNLILIPSHVMALGFEKTKAVLCVSIMGGCEVVARIFFGWFADNQFMQPK